MSTKYHDYYKTLGVDRKASTEEIQRAYRKLAREYHPDVNKQAGAEAKFKEIGEAYEVLKDPQKRKLYDQLGSDWKAGQEFKAPPGWRPGGGFRGQGSPSGQPTNVDFSDFFESLFGGGFQADDFAAGMGRGAGTARSARPRRGADHEAEVTIALAEAYRGGTRQVSLTEESTGQSQRYDIKIPAGVTDGSVIRLAGQGSPGRSGGSAGDLLLTIRIAPDPRFRIESGESGEPGHDLVTSVLVTPSEAALGAKVDVHTLDGQVRMTVPAGCQPGQRLRIRGQGMPKRSGERGDLFAEIKVLIPRELSDVQRRLYEQLRESESGHSPT